MDKEKLVAHLECIKTHFEEKEFSGFWGLWDKRFAEGAVATLDGLLEDIDRGVFDV